MFVRFGYEFYEVLIIFNFFLIFRGSSRSLVFFSIMLLYVKDFKIWFFFLVCVLNNDFVFINMLCRVIYRYTVFVIIFYLLMFLCLMLKMFWNLCWRYLEKMRNDSLFIEDLSLYSLYSI